jgi:hypothetical protein
MFDIICMKLCIIYYILHEVHLHLFSVHIYCECHMYCICNDDGILFMDLVS